MIKHYRANVEEAQNQIRDLQKRINANSVFRLLVIVLVGILLFKSFNTDNVWLVLLILIIGTVLFLFLVARQSKLEAKKSYMMAFLSVNQNEVNVADRRTNLYSNGARYQNEKHPYTSDLDVFGEHSMFEYINRAATIEGNDTLATWLSEPSDINVILDRQQAVKELADKVAWSLKFQTLLLPNLEATRGVKNFLLDYFKGNRVSFGKRFMKVYVKLAPFLMLFGVILSFFLSSFFSFVVTLAIIHFLWSMFLSGKVSLFSGKTGKASQALESYAVAIKHLELEPFDSRLGRELKNNFMLNNGEPLSGAVKKLGTLMNKLDARNNIFVGGVLNIVFLWDFKQVMAIQRWNTQYGDTIEIALDTVAYFDALVSLGTLTRNHSDWAMPEVAGQPADTPFIGNDIKHPLIRQKNNIGNDFSIDEYRIALITGSNMAGKSTFLRTVGLNFVLAYAGTVVNAASLSLPIYRIVTYMRIKDSLNESTSTFKAELDRMKFILEKVEDRMDNFFLIDEMLRGTNSVDKYLGSRAVIRKLSQLGGRGMVATHDLQLSTLQEELPSIVKNFHFDIQVQNQEMLFDYKLKAGECKVFNATMLLKNIGIEVE